MPAYPFLETPVRIGDVKESVTPIARGSWENLEVTKSALGCLLSHNRSMKTFVSRAAVSEYLKEPFCCASCRQLLACRKLVNRCDGSRVSLRWPVRVSSTNRMLNLTECCPVLIFSYYDLLGQLGRAMLRGVNKQTSEQHAFFQTQDALICG
uniref:Lysyl oxidase n=1 Tax=Nothobranchius furzeri TaxID=105023 RepID=A0A1A8UN08_NOTFU